MVNNPHFGGTTRRANLHKEFHVGRVVLSPLFGDVVLVVDGFNRTHRLTRTTIHTLIGVDIEHTIAFIDAIDRAFIDAGSIFNIHTGKCDYIGHC
jgi:hypothetical protein